MKKIATLLIVITMVISLSLCGCVTKKAIGNADSTSVDTTAVVADSVK